MSNDIGKASINLKMSDELKEKIKIRANYRKQTLSKYLRELISNYFDGTLCKGEVARNETKEFINSTEFLQVVVWIYSKKGAKKVKETQTDLDKYIGILKKTEQYLPKHLISEFDKVLLDLIRVTNDVGVYSKEYKFVDGETSSLRFDFEVLEKYLLNYEKKIIITPSLFGNKSLMNIGDKKVLSTVIKK